MKLGISAFAWSSTFEVDDLKILPFVKNCGFQALEIPMFDPSRLPVGPIRRALESAGLDCTVCAILPQTINPIDPDRTVREAAKNHLATCIKTAAKMGATLIGGPLYAPIRYLPPHRPTDEEIEWAVKVFQSVTGLLEEHEITLALEPVNRSETCFLRTGEAAANLCDAIDHPLVGVTIDTFHANIEEKGIANAIVSLGKKLRHVHASENDRGIVGSGHIDFRGILKALQDEDYMGYIIVEGFGLPSHGRAAPGTLWADAGTTPEVLAQGSYTFLRELIDELYA